MERRLLLSGSQAMWALEEIQLQTLAAKDAHDGNISDKFIPFLDFKVHVNKYFFRTFVFRVGQLRS